MGFGPPYVGQNDTGRDDDNNNDILNYVGWDIEPISRDAICSASGCTNQTDCENADHSCNGAVCSKTRCTNKADCESAHACNSQTAGRWTNLEGHPFITWSCLDKAKEVKHRIHLLIREWNTQEEFNRFKESNGSRGDSDIVGLEGSGCDYYESNQ